MGRSSFRIILLAGASALPSRSARPRLPPWLRQPPAERNRQGFSFAGAGTSAFGLGSMFWNPANITNFAGRNSEWNVTLIVPDTSVTTTGAGFASPLLAPLNALVPASAPRRAT